MVPQDLKAKHNVAIVKSQKFLTKLSTTKFCEKSFPMGMLSMSCENLSSVSEAFKLLRIIIRELVDSLCRDGADAQYMQYLSKSRITSPQIR